MINLLESLGAIVSFIPEENYLEVDTSTINCFEVNPEIMNKMRASILVMGSLLARFKKANVALPGGCVIGTRPIDIHLEGLRNLGVSIKQSGDFLNATINATISDNFSLERRIILEYPSVGATENIMLCAALTPGDTTIVNAAFEPEVFDLVSVLQKMGAEIRYGRGLVIHITGVNALHPVQHEIIPDRLEAGSLLLATAITGGELTISNGQPEFMDLFLQKLQEMGHMIDVRDGIRLNATSTPKAVNIKTAPYPGFPTDLQAPMMAALTLANGVSEVEETVFENRLMHAQELNKMGAQITTDGRNAVVRGVEGLYGCDVIASDIRASCALAIAGLAAQGNTSMIGVNHWNRGYDRLEDKLVTLGAAVSISFS